MLSNVLIRLAANTGLHPVQQRTTLVNLLNQAADELYNMLECNKIYREVTLVVAPDSVVALPSFIGELRGMRMHTNELPFDLASMSSPRYVSTTLSFKFKNWRDKGDSAIQFIPTTFGQLTFSTTVVEDSPISIIVSGQTNKAFRIEETVVMDSLSKSTTNLFGPRIDSIACLSNRSSDVVVTDALGNVLATLYNTDKKTRYKIVDVSQIFWTLDSSDGNSLIDVCYKIPKTVLSNDSDSFYAGDDFDNAWFAMAMSIYLKPQTGRADEAMQFKADAIQSCQSAKESGEAEIVKKVGYGRNKFFGLFRKYRYYPGAVTSVDHNVQS